MQGRPKISVVIPVFDYRVQAEFFDSWTDQDVDHPEDYELVVVSHGDDPRIDQQIADRLRPHDRLLITPELRESRSARYNAGVDAAASDLLLLTEDHCVADPACVRHTLRFLEQGDEPAGWLMGDFRRDNPLADAEAMLTEEFILEQGKDQPWKRVQMRGFACHRDFLAGYGGLPTEFGEFGPTALGIEMYQRGVELPQVPEALVIHVNHHSLPGFREDCMGYFFGEVAYRRAFPESHCFPFMQGRDPWQARAALGDAPTREAWRALLACLKACRRLPTGQRLPAARRLIAELTRLAPQRLFGVRLLYNWAWLKVQAAEARWRLGVNNLPRRGELMSSLWTAWVHYHRMQAERELPPITATPSPTASGGTIDHTPEENLRGVHAVERLDGAPFRWTEPVATVLLPVDAEEQTIELRVLPVRGPVESLAVGVLFNGVPVGRERLRLEGDTIALDVSAAECGAGCQRLTIACDPLLPPGDTRRLGLPLASIAWRAAGASPASGLSADASPPKEAAA